VQQGCGAGTAHLPFPAPSALLSPQKQAFPKSSKPSFQACPLNHRQGKCQEPQRQETAEQEEVPPCQLPPSPHREAG